LYRKNNDYLFITYIVTSKPKRISVAAGVVHIIILLKLLNKCFFVKYIIVQISTFPSIKVID